jgi:hypothetical protein
MIARKMCRNLFADLLTQKEVIILHPSSHHHFYLIRENETIIIFLTS